MPDKAQAPVKKSASQAGSPTNGAKRKAAPSPASGRSGKGTSDGLVEVTPRNGYYKDGSKKLIIAAGISIVCLAAQVFVASLAYTAKSERVYIATQPDGRLIKLIALSQPNQKDEVVAQWMQTALVDTFGFNFTNMKTHLSSATMRWFTSYGADQFLSEMQKAGYLEVVTEGKMILNLTLEHTPVLVKRGRDPVTGIFGWTMQADGLITFRTQSREFTRKVRFTILVERRSILETAEGLGIAKMIMKSR
jgi:intracellular multiplication protein IcmL